MEQEKIEIEERLRENVLRLERNLQRAHQLQTEAEAQLAGLEGIALASSSNDIVQALMLATVRLFACDDAAFLESDSDNAIWEVKASTIPGLRGAQLKSGSLFERVHDGQTVAVFDVRATQEWGAIPVERLEGVAAAIHGPVTIDDQTAILVGLHPDPSYFASQQVNQLRRFLRTAAQVIASHQTRAEERQRRIAEERATALQQSNQQLAHQLETIRRQQERIARLFAPVIGVGDGVIMVPLLGPLDAAQTTQATQRILDAMSRSTVRSVILDLTGVDVVDTSVCVQLGNMAKMVRLLGGECFLTGLRPEVASIIAILEIDTSVFRTERTVAQALRTCLREAKRNGTS